MKIYFERAIANIARFGDTDIFPHPFERFVFEDCKKEALDLLLRAHREFFGKKEEKTEDGKEGGKKDKKTEDGKRGRKKDKKTAGEYVVPPFLQDFPPVNSHALSPVGHTGFRWATLIDPFWNVYLLGLALSLEKEIEKTRLPQTLKAIFSYRLQYNKDTHTLFNPDCNWRAFMEASRQAAIETEEKRIARQKDTEGRTKKQDRISARGTSWVVACDIADFYPRVYHHRLENALLQITDSDTPKRVDRLLNAFSGNRSYGLPIGGPAARILSELVLNNVDQLLYMEGIRFCRYVDDYHIFAESKEEAFSHLLFLTEKLLRNEGLALQKSKTRLYRTSEFQRHVEYLLGEDQPDSSKSPTARLLRIDISFNPYAHDPVDNYKRLKKKVGNFDIVGMLSSEIDKSRIHAAAARKLIRAARYLDEEEVVAVLKVILDNMSSLAPVFAHCMLFARDVLDRLPDHEQSHLVDGLAELLLKPNHVSSLELNRLYIIRVIAKCWTPKAQSALNRTYRNPDASPVLRRDILITMAKWRKHQWVFDALQGFPTMSDWERRGAILGSFALRDEGKHWRKNRRRQLTPFEKILSDWAGPKISNKNWDLPI